MSIEVFNVDTKLLATTPLEQSVPIERKTYSIMEIPTKFIGEMDNNIVNSICHKGSEPNFTLPTSEVNLRLGKSLHIAVRDRTKARDLPPKDK
ncbi:hypothetical protein CARUB_v10010760mg [Capsella rubella]|uniref:Uncharacterized protein n=1 Tax=Capsella rubella TaxID=81985 RepID=R0GMP5_9BRAS|nr:hypothetical protein CARUB_v10010760mg [Capsella rubella]